MNTVARLEQQILALHEQLGLRTTLERAARLGELLTEAKQELPHGESQTWCKRLPFKYRSAAIYMAVFANAEKCREMHI